ncbi:MAG TPA: succinate dehydrogenase, hydrophobic membrane anchor protein [Tabrizicola sp.]|nr:succinate dehydrogenase, hydrophobic membrane anchor protein [Tabrizicola sp.]
MRYLTPRKRAEGKGSAHAGAEHHWAMTVSSVALAFLVPAWLYVFGQALGESRETVVATFAEPFPAILTVLILIVGMRHFAMGATTMIEDYSRGASRKVLIIAVTLFAWATVATGLFALARIAL